MATKLQSRWLGVLTFSAFLTVLATLLVLTLPAQDASAKQKQQPRDSAKGQGVNAFGAKFKFNAQATDTDPETDTAKGTVSLKFDEGEGSFKANVRCLRVSDNGAYLIAKVTKSTFAPVDRGDLIQIEAFDSGQPNGEGDKERDTHAESDTCRDPGELSDEFLIQDGDVEVRDVL